jgi:hypothetical protein
MLLAVLIVIALALLTCAGLVAMLCVELWEIHRALDHYASEYHALRTFLDDSRDNRDTND